MDKHNLHKQKLWGSSILKSVKRFWGQNVWELPVYCTKYFISLKTLYAVKKLSINLLSYFFHLYSIYYLFFYINCELIIKYNSASLAGFSDL